MAENENGQHQNDYTVRNRQIRPRVTLNWH